MDNEAESAEDRNHPDEDIDRLLGESSVCSDRGVKDPDKTEDWHLCRDFLDPMAEELDEWLKEFWKDEEKADFESLRWFTVGMDGFAGPTARCNAWARAKVELDILTSLDFRRAFEANLCDFAAETEGVLHSLRSPIMVNGEDWTDVRRFGFAVQEVEHCWRYLRDVSVVVGRKLPPVPPAADLRGGTAGAPEVDRGSTGSVPSGGDETVERRMNVPSWSQLRIGISERREYLAVASHIEMGAVFPKNSAAPLELRGRQWEVLLGLMARSQDGNSADKYDVMRGFGYIDWNRPRPIDRSELIEDNVAMVMLKKATTQLTGAVADLSRKLRRQISAREAPRPVLSAATEKEVTAAFVVRHLLRGPDGKLRFGKPPG